MAQVASERKRAVNDLTDTYSLSPVQLGILFSSLGARRAGTGMNQVIVTLHEMVDLAALERAWCHALQRHDILRTGFRWDGVPEPMQEVHAHARAEWTQADWRYLTAACREQRFESLLEADRRRGFDLARPPLTRFALLHTGLREFTLVWTYHDLILDRAAQNELLREVFAEYDGGGQEPNPAAPSRHPYHGYVRRWQNQDGNRAETFWREVLNGCQPGSPAAAAPGDVVPSSPSTALSSLTLPHELTVACELLGRRHACPLDSVLFAAWGFLAGRCLDRDDVVFGVPVGTRERALGPQERFLPLRVALPDDQTAGDYVRDTGRAVRRIRAEEAAPLIDIHRWSGVPFDRPLLDSVCEFSLMDPPAEDDAGGTARKVSVRRGCGHSFVLEIEQHADAVKLYLRCAPAAGGDTYAARMLARLRTILENFTADPDRCLAEVAWTTNAEQREVLDVWNRTSSDFPRNISVAELFALHARMFPGELAVAAGDCWTTYGELDEQARIIASCLTLPRPPGALVGVMLDRGTDWIAAMLGIWKNGAAYVPLDPAWPGERLAFVLADSGVTAVVTHSRYRQRLPGSIMVLCVDELPDGELPVPFVVPGKQTLACVVYAANSLGRLRGVCLTHRSLCNLIAWHNRAYSVTADDRASQVFSVAAEVAAWEIWPYLIAGASVHLPEEEVRADAARLLQWLDERRITLCHLPVELADDVLLEPWPENLSLRALLTSGDRRPRRSGTKCTALHVHHFGTSECGLAATWGVTGTTVPAWGAPPSGQPIANVRAFVLGRRGLPLPVGVAGELLVGGEGIAQGYWRDAFSTAEKFLKQPGWAGGEGNLYRTGKVARWRADGYIEFLSGRDASGATPAAVNAFEVESAMFAHPAVRRAVAVAITRPGHAPHWVIYYIPRGRSQPAAGEWCDYLAGRLPGRSIPAKFVACDEFPRTVDGDTDREALAQLELSADERWPVNPVEQSIAGLWCELLGRPTVEREDNFFALGGDPLGALQLVSKLREEFRIDLPCAALVEHPTLTALAAVVETWRNRHTPRPRILRFDLPLSRPATPPALVRVPVLATSPN